MPRTLMSYLGDWADLAAANGCWLEADYMADCIWCFAWTGERICLAMREEIDNARDLDQLIHERIEAFAKVKQNHLH